MPKPNNIHFEKAHVVRVNRRHRFWLFFLVLFLILAGPVASHYGTLLVVGGENRELRSRVLAQTELINSLKAELANLEQLAANLGMASEIDKNSLEYMRKEMVSSQAQAEVLQEQLRFYQSLMDPNPDQGGVYIETVSIEPTVNSGEYRYNIVVAQRSSNHTRIKGSVGVELISEVNSEQIQTIALSELAGDQDSLSLGFKFFQQLDGAIFLPDGFNPTKIRVTVELEGSSPQRLEETFVWAS